MHPLTRHSFYCAAALALFPLAPGASQAQAPALLGTSPADLTLLKQSLALLASPGPLQSTSTMQMSGSKQGISFTFREQVSIIAKQPGKFRAEITQYSADNSPQMHLLVISDGQNVSTYRPGTNQYSVRSSKSFHDANDDMTALGLAIGGFFLGEGHDLAVGLQNITKDTTPLTLKELAKNGVVATQRTEGVDGEDDYVYRLALVNQGITYRFVINPHTAVLRQIELSGKQNGVTMAFRETIATLGKPGSIAKTAFQFVPPAGAAKIAALSVDPF